MGKASAMAWGNVFLLIVGIVVSWLVNK